MTEELKKIKDMYGEKMMQICRRNFATLLDTPGVLYDILSNHIAPTHSLADDIIDRYAEEEFKDFILAFTDTKEKEIVDTGKNPFELMREAGYILRECRNEEDIQSFKHYYKEGEALCTFNGGRLNRCRVFFAVKENASSLKREDFTEPKREDEYGTSVISIQFSHGALNTLSIKNRYNHTVNNPDATFFNNLENIIPGLTRSFEKAYRLNIVSETEHEYNLLTDDLPYTQGYIPPRDENGNEIEIDDKKKVERKYYRYNFEANGIYFCENNIIIKDGKVIDYYNKDKGRYIVADNYIIDTHEKTIYPYSYQDEKEIENKGKEKPKDAFTTSITEVGEIKNITLQKDNGNRVIKIKYTDGKEVFITIDKTNSIVGYKNEYIKKLNQGFMLENRKLRQLSVDNVEIVESECLPHNGGMEELSLPNALCLGHNFFNHNSYMRKLNIPKVIEMGNYALENNRRLEELIAPSLERIGYKVLYENQALRGLSLPNVKYIADYFVNQNGGCWKMIYMPKLIKLFGGAFSSIRSVDYINMDSVEEIGPLFLYSEEYLRELSLPSAINIYDGFMDANHNLNYFSAPKLENFSKNSFSNNTRMRDEILYCLKNKKPCEVFVQDRYRMF